MKFIACADLHFTDKIPRNRKDLYFQTQLEKLSQIIQIAEHEKASVLVAGDVFDTHKTPYKITKKLIQRLKSAQVVFYAVPGQHDLVYHSDGLNNTPLGLLSTLDNVNILSSNKSTLISKDSESISLIGSGWNEEPTNEADIVVAHEMVVHKEPLFPGQKDYSTAKQILRKYGYASLIVSGDNHQPFVVKKKRQTLINCGSMMRKSKDQIKYKPVIWLINSTDWSVKKIQLKIQPASKVFDMNKIKNDEIQEDIKNKAQEDVDKFVKSLDINEYEKPRFENVLKRVIDEVKPDTQVIKTINDLMETLA